MRIETKARARALQLLYAWDIQDEPSLGGVAGRLQRLGRGRVPAADRAEALAAAVVADRERLDEAIAAVVEGWRLSRLGCVERNLLRLGLCELLEGTTPPKVVIDEAVYLAQLFAGAKAPAFVNGVLDALARQHGRL